MLISLASIRLRNEGGSNYANYVYYYVLMTSNLSDIFLNLLWLAIYHRNISAFFVTGTGGTL